MRHCHFLKSTCDIGDPPSRAPNTRMLGVEGFLKTLRIISPWMVRAITLHPETSTEPVRDRTRELIVLHQRPQDGRTVRG